MSKSWLRHGYNKVSRIVGRADTKKKDFPVLEGHPVGQTHAEQAVETHGTIQSNIKRLMKEFKIYRWNQVEPWPSQQQALPRVPLCRPLQPWTNINGTFSSLIKYFVSKRKSISIMQYSTALFHVVYGTTHFQMVDYDRLSIHYFWFVEVCRIG